MKRTIFCYLFFIICSGQLTAQIRLTDTRDISEKMRYSVEKRFNSWALTAGYGPVIMHTDISDYSFFPKSNWNFGPTIILSKQLVPPLAIDLQYMFSDMYGEKDKYFFEGDFRDISLNAVLYINQLGARPGPVNHVWNFYIKAGAGANYYRSALKFKESGDFVSGTEFNLPNHFMVTGYDRYSPEEEVKRKRDIVVPVGGGVLYRLNEHFDAGVETTIRFTTTDHLDNILTGSTNDRYFYTTVNLSYKIGKKDKPHMRWTFRGLGMNLLGRPRKDMLREEIQRMEDEIQKLASQPPMGRDSVVIQNTLTTIYETVYIKSLFFKPNAEISFSIEDQILMAEIAVLMKHNPEKELQLYGYVDPEDKGDHYDLSRAQCEKVLDYLVYDLGANPNAIRIYPRGSSDAFVGSELSTSQIRRMANRRVDMVFRE